MTETTTKKVNSSWAAVVGDVDSVDAVYKPSTKLAFYCRNVECRPVDHSSTNRNQHGQYLNTCREYGLTGEIVAWILLSSKSYLHKVPNSKTNKVNRSASSWQCGRFREDCRAALYRLRSSAQSWHSFFTRCSFSAWKGASL